MENIFLELVIGASALIFGWLSKHLMTINEVAKMKADIAKSELENQNLKLQYESDIMEALMKSRTQVVQLAEEASNLDMMVRKLKDQLHELTEKINVLIQENSDLRKKLIDMGIG